MLLSLLSVWVANVSSNPTCVPSRLLLSWALLALRLKMVRPNILVVLPLLCLHPTVPVPCGLSGLQRQLVLAARLGWSCLTMFSSRLYAYAQLESTPLVAAHLVQHFRQLVSTRLCCLWISVVWLINLVALLVLYVACLFVRCQLCLLRVCLLLLLTCVWLLALRPGLVLLWPPLPVQWVPRCPGKASNLPVLTRLRFNELLSLLCVCEVRLLVRQLCQAMRCHRNIFLSKMVNQLCVLFLSQRDLVVGLVGGGEVERCASELLQLSVSIRFAQPNEYFPHFRNWLKPADRR